MEVRSCITTTRRSRSSLLNPPAASSANSCKGVRAWYPPRGGGNDERRKSPKPRTGDFRLSWKAQTPRFPHSHPHDYYCCTRFTAQAKQQNHDCATRYLPDLPTDSSEEAKDSTAGLSGGHS